MSITTIQNIPFIYINLEKRKSRAKAVLKELEKLGITNYERFNACENENGALGCSLSHIKCLELAIERNYDKVIIIEDDIEFLNPELFIKQSTKFLNSNLEWDVFLLGGNNTLPFNFVNDSCIKIYKCQTTTGYCVKRQYYEKLLDNFKKSYLLLNSEPTNEAYKIDKYWMRLQMLDNWYLIIPPSVIQREDYSDIEKKTTNYKNLMLNINKKVIQPIT